MAWSLAFLIQNNMNPIIIFEVSSQPRRFVKLLDGTESCSEKMNVFGKYLCDKLAEFGADAELLIENKSPLKMWKPQISRTDAAPTLSVHTSSIFQSIQNNKIPVICNMVDLDENQPTNCLYILEILVSKF